MFTWSVQEGLGRRSMDSINHRLHRLLLSANLLEHVFEGLGCVNECYRSLFTTITKTRTSKKTHYICHVGEGLGSRVCFLVPETHSWSQCLYQCGNIQQLIIARFVLYLYHVVSYHNDDIPSFSIFAVIKWIIFIFLILLCLRLVLILYYVIFNEYQSC